MYQFLVSRDQEKRRTMAHTSQTRKSRLINCMTPSAKGRSNTPTNHPPAVNALSVPPAWEMVALP